MRGILRRIISYTLTAALIAGISPAVFGNQQSNVGVLAISGKDTPMGSAVYNVSLTWDKPGVSPKADTNAYSDATGDDRTDLHEVSHYRFEYRQVSANSGAVFVPVPGAGNYTPRAGDNGPYTVNIQNLNLQNASIYEFRVVPVHTHRYLQGYDDVSGTLVPRLINDNAMYDAQTTEQRAWFFTDYVVDSVSALGRDITVTWTVPAYGGKDPFERYLIYWSMTPTTTVPMDLSTAFSKEVRAAAGTANLKITTLPGQLQYTHTFTAKENEFIMGGDYSLRIEPAAGTASTSPWRQDNGATVLRPPNIPANTGVLTYSWAATDRNAREYRASEVFRLQIPLGVVKETDGRLRIYWDIEFLPKNNPTVSVYKMTPGGETEFLGKLGSAATSTINYWLTDDEGPMLYYIVINDDPNNRSEYCSYDPAAVEFQPYNPSILRVERNSGTNAWQITWEAFLREYFNPDEAAELIPGGAYAGQYIDRDVEYDIWVSDDVSALYENILSSLYSYAPGVGGDNYAFEDADTGKWVYYKTVTRYTTREGATLDITDNKLYYVKIVASRNGQVSEPAYYSFYFGPEGVPTNPLMMSKPPLNVDSTTMTAINISWTPRWFEVYNDHKGPYGNTAYPEGWYSSFGYANGEYVYGEKPVPGEVYDLSAHRLQELSQADAYAEIDGYAPVPTPAGVLPKRAVDITGAGYEIYVAKYDDVIGTTGDAADAVLAAESFLAQIISAGVPWNVIIPPPSNKDAYTYSIADSTAVGAIEANTAYVVFFRPIGETGLAAWYPTYVTATTPGDPGTIIVTPTTPTLKVDTAKTGIREITVYWELSTALSYDLAYSDDITQYSGGGTGISFSEIQANGYQDTIDGKLCWVYELTELFANTEYYIWIRSSAQGGRVSDWSNPVSEKTEDIGVPSPPRGLGIAAEDILAAYNKENTAELTPKGTDYMVIQWTRDYSDDGTETTSSATGDVVRLDTAALLNTMYMAKFGGLVANRDYYLRAKTILTMLRTGTTIKLQYSYCVQLSETDEFTDVWEIYIPTLDPVPANERDIIRKESEWTSVYNYRTLTSPDEFDGQWDERLYPLPQSDLEISYDNMTGELKYRLRSDGIAEDGTHDNGVDQRFISRMIAERVYTYALDMTSYDNYRIYKRTLEIPYTIMRAMDERKVSLRLTADNMTVTFAPGSVNTIDAAVLKDFGRGSYVRFSLEPSPAGMPELITGDSYVSEPHKLTVTVTTQAQTLGLAGFGQDAEVAMKLGNRYVTYDKNVGAYTNDANTPGWTFINSAYDNAAGTLTFTTRKAGTYSAIAKRLPLATDGSGAAYTLMTKLNITDLINYNPADPINASHFNNIVAAIARNRKSVAIYESMSAEDYEALGKSGTLVSGSTVSREAGIAALIRLYELKTNATVKAYGTVAATPYTDIATASAQYQTALLKAAKLGFFTGASTSPKAMLTMKDAFEYFEIIIDDAGL